MQKEKEFIQDTVRILVVILGIAVLCWCVSLWSPEAHAAPSDEIKACYEKYDIDVYGKAIHGQDIIIDCILRFLDENKSGGRNVL